MTLRERVELDATVFGSLNLHDGEVLLVEDEGVGIVVHHHNLMSLGEIDQPLIGLPPCIASRGHVGIVGPEEFHAGEIHLLKFIEIRLPSVVFL